MRTASSLQLVAGDRRSKNEFVDTFEALTLASEFPEPFRWTYEGPCRVEHAGESWERRVVASWDDSGVGILDDHDRAVWQIALGGLYGKRGPSVTAAAADGYWSTSHAHVYTTDGNAGTTELHWAQMR